MLKAKILSETESLCPSCLKKIPARRVTYGNNVFLEKRCEAHGSFKTIIWRGDPPFSEWSRPKIPSTPLQCYTEADKGCPFDCGLCTDHGQHTCTALLEITQRCNLKCPVCFAASNDSAATSGDGTGTSGEGILRDDPDMEKIAFWYKQVWKASGNCNIQLSGGEPTMRDDLPEIIEMGRKTGFEFIQLNTNGLRAAREAGFARKLGDAGLSSVFLQFDGVDDGVYGKIRGRALFEEKQKAIERFGDANIGVVLVPTLVPGVNTRMIGDIIRFGLDRAPVVRGVHFQPLSYFGRYPKPPSDGDRITIPEILTRMEAQTNGLIRKENFQPPGCEHSLCSFHGNFMIMPDNTLKPLTTEKSGGCCAPPIKAEEGARQAVSSVKRQWAAPATSTSESESKSESESESAHCGCGCGEDVGDAFDIFLKRAKTHIFAVSGMAFQDAWNMDIERLKGCCIHTVSPEGKLIPFCAYNVTNDQGKALYRK